MNFADTNWLASVYIEPAGGGYRSRQAEAHRLSASCASTAGQLAISHVVLLEARNVFIRITGEEQPREWQTLEADFGGRLYVDPMNWDLLRRECNALFSKYAWKADLGTFDTAIVASAKLSGGTSFLSFDAKARALASAEGIGVFPVLEPAERRQLAQLKR